MSMLIFCEVLLLLLERKLWKCRKKKSFSFVVPLLTLIIILILITIDNGEKFRKKQTIFLKEIKAFIRIKDGQLLNNYALQDWELMMQQISPANTTTDEAKCRLPQEALERAATKTAVGATAAASGGDEAWRRLATVGPLSGNDEKRHAARDLPWFMKGGSRLPLPAMRSQKTGRRLARIWPQEAPDSDRITDQLMFVPPLAASTNGVESATRSAEIPKRLKTILIYNTKVWSGKIKRKRAQFTHCPVKTCTITTKKKAAAYVDLIVFKDAVAKIGKYIRPPNQIWVLYLLESPVHSSATKLSSSINWTATYRGDSDIVTPYGRWVYYNERVKQNPNMKRNYAANKTRKVAWFVSNCYARNRRLEYALELQKYIPVDIYGECGSKQCSVDNKHCFEMLKSEYKFYLAFENTNCRDYITEKLYINSYRYDVLPVVMGARPEDYARVAPLRSYIHVNEFESPRHLASYLWRIDADDDLYNMYFRWKGTGEFINTHFFCRVCAMLHDDYSTKTYSDINDWWYRLGMCGSFTSRLEIHPVWPFLVIIVQSIKI